MANICSYKVKVKGKRNACYAFFGSMASDYGKRIVHEEGTEDNTVIIFDGTCKWDVDYGCNPWDGDYPVEIPEVAEEAYAYAEDKYWYYTLTTRSRMFNVEVWCDYVDLDNAFITREEAYEMEIPEEEIDAFLEMMNGQFYESESFPVAYVHYINGVEVNDDCPQELYFKREELNIGSIEDEDLDDFDEDEEKNVDDYRYDEKEEAANQNGFVISDGVLQRYEGDDNEIVIPDSVRIIGSEAFAFCETITSIIIPQSVTIIEAGAFCHCVSLVNIMLPNSITIISNSMFAECESLKNITIPDSVTSIDTDAFYGCTSLASITIPDSVTSIGRGAFSDCDLLSFNEYDNACYLGNENNPYMALIKVQSTSIENCAIHTKTKLIAENALNDCNSLTSVTIPDSVTSIGDWAFSNCTSLASITIPDSVMSIGIYAFSNCASLTIYCEVESQPSKWNSRWNPNSRPVVWGYNE